MDEIKLSDDVIEQIKDFNHNNHLTEEQELSSINKLITDKEYAVWKDGPWEINYGNDQLEREGKLKVALKCLRNLKGITADFLKEIESNILVCDTGWVVRCFGITKDPKTNDFIMVMELKMVQHLNNNFISPNWKQKLQNLYNIAYAQ
ncbi:uncharacterized protein OCT59_011840 [Rhizophagus irregularis]|uniref:Protein kinase domain-containing protein n=1 Tax=Rhizophagus irregularis (strain DAOM 197198w) TaxID=1432141 RepID=A0A015IJW8_RHIIW|nr:hypothetical protein RirG_234790 [Rhizophagus irregularis DAOM 197198w]UZO00721.1 hypothetical protein OCT59_011840 [Rhizophagus irregularis]GBC39506.2 kinase-like domain-containing protein [Rhizophagus irregularis DAOM 181602=DAOM 197198]